MIGPNLNFLFKLYDISPVQIPSQDRGSKKVLVLYMNKKNYTQGSPLVCIGAYMACGYYNLQN